MENEYLKEGIALCKQGEFDKAIVVLKKGLKKTPQDEELLHNLSVAYARVNKFQEAMKCVNTVLKHNPENAKVLSERAVLFYHLGQHEAAMTDLNKAVELEPYNPFRFSSRAWIRSKAGEIEEAIADYEMAIVLDPEDAISINNKGMLEEQLGYNEMAKESFGRADELVGREKSTRTYESNKSNISARSEDEQANGEEVNKKMSFSHFIGTLGKILFSKETRKEFFRFLKYKIKK